MNDEKIVNVEIVEKYVKYYDEKFNLINENDVVKITTYFKYLHQFLNLFRNYKTSYNQFNEFEIVKIEIDENVNVDEIFEKIGMI